MTEDMEGQQKRFLSYFRYTYTVIKIYVTKIGFILGSAHSYLPELIKCLWARIIQFRNETKDKDKYSQITYVKVFPFWKSLDIHALINGFAVIQGWYRMLYVTS